MNSVEQRCCPTCGQGITSQKHINWTEAFNKFGYNDGDGEVYTDEIAHHIEKLEGVLCTANGWGCHNTVIDSIRVQGVEVIHNNIEIGYDDPRDYLPSFIVKHLDATYYGEWYG